MRLGQSRIIFATLLFAAMIVSITARVASAAPAAGLLKLAEGEFSNFTRVAGRAHQCRATSVRSDARS